MGYFLLFEGLIESVLLARDKFLVKDGLIMPDRGVLFVATIEDEEYRAKKHNFWYVVKILTFRKKVYGVNMECMVDWVATEPSNEKINNNQVNAESCPILEVDLYKVPFYNPLQTQLGELDFSNEYKVRMTRNDYVHGLIGWFEVYFTSSHLPIRISSAPFSKGTLWKQTVFHFRDTIICHRNDQIKGSSIFLDL
jgi:protein arginine N-methyltransferase 1